ncbi:hypothetical protein [Terriglobus roseus]|uniref:Uncharacterized protein n=1 Tax=Terriglobus roseus TaxID=392734 RepID=A0A1G7IBJ9_9BACT|nr:hypothetical protein [Terriglobus roseus]SDF10127.1 hypothetical protein SAMN05444167_1390 [Terriglobus roseus]
MNQMELTMDDAALEELDDAIHALSQPLTALLFAVEMAALRTTPDEIQDALNTARAECRRAVAELERVREAAARLEAGGSR